jgi:hypothetical protein
MLPKSYPHSGSIPGGGGQDSSSISGDEPERRTSRGVECNFLLTIWRNHMRLDMHYVVSSMRQPDACFSIPWLPSTYMGDLLYHRLSNLQLLDNLSAASLFFSSFS